jgi:hypothetical protein
MRVVNAVAVVLALASAVEAQAPGERALGPSVFWGSLCRAQGCVEGVDGAGAGVRGALPLGDWVVGEAAGIYWYGSTRSETVRRVSLFLTARFYPSRGSAAFVRAGGGLSWDLDEGPAHPAGVLGVGWDIRGWLGGTVTPFLDAALFGPPEPLPALRLVSGGVELAWPF